MIQSFKDRVTEDLFHGVRSKSVSKFPSQVVKTAVRKLDMVNSASQLVDLRVPPANRLEALKGDLKGFYSIRVNDQWRIVFRWSEGGPAEVALRDYH